MSGFDTKQKLVLGGALLLCVIMWLSLAGDDGGLTVQNSPPPQVKSQGQSNKKIIGADIASQKLPVKNPFTITHDDRAASVTPATPKAPPQAAQPTATPAVTSSGSNTATPAQTTPAPTLTGIAQGASSTLAIIQTSDASYCVGPGEQAGPWQVVAIYERSCIITGPGGEQTLYLP